MTRDLQSSSYLASVGLALYPLGFGLVPIFAAPISEETGRRPMFIIAMFCLTFMHVMVGACVFRTKDSGNHTHLQV